MEVIWGWHFTSPLPTLQCIKRAHAQHWTMSFLFWCLCPLPGSVCCLQSLAANWRNLESESPHQSEGGDGQRGHVSTTGKADYLISFHQTIVIGIWRHQWRWVTRLYSFIFPYPWSICGYRYLSVFLLQYSLSYASFENLWVVPLWYGVTSVTVLGMYE